MRTWIKTGKVLLWTELWVITAMILLGMLWAPGLLAAPLIGLFFILLRVAIEQKLPISTPADFQISLLVLMIPVNFLVSPDAERAVSALLRLAGGIVLFLAVVNWTKTHNRLRWLIAITGLAALGLSIFSLFAVDWTYGKLLFIPKNVYEQFALLLEDTIHPNVLGGSLIAFVPLIMAVPLFTPGKKYWIESIWFPLILVGVSGALVLSQSRGALLALAAALVIMLLIRYRWFWSLPVICIGALITAITLLGNENIVFQLYDQITDLLVVKGYGQRTDIWLRAIFMLQDFPFTGVGMGQFSDAFQNLYPMTLEADAYMPHAHNIFLQVGADLGIIGLILWLSILISVILASWRVYRKGRMTKNPWFTGLGAGLFCSMLAISFHGLMDSVLWGEIRSASIIWWMWGLTMAALNISQQEPEREKRRTD